MIRCDRDMQRWRERKAMCKWIEVLYQNYVRSSSFSLFCTLAYFVHTQIKQKKTKCRHANFNLKVLNILLCESIHFHVEKRFQFSKRRNEKTVKQTAKAALTAWNHRNFANKNSLYSFRQSVSCYFS